MYKRQIEGQNSTTFAYLESFSEAKDSNNDDKEGAHPWSVKTSFDDPIVASKPADIYQSYNFQIQVEPGDYFEFGIGYLSSDPTTGRRAIFRSIDDGSIRVELRENVQGSVPSSSHTDNQIKRLSDIEVARAIDLSLIHI